MASQIRMGKRIFGAKRRNQEDAVDFRFLQQHSNRQQSNDCLPYIPRKTSSDESHDDSCTLADTQGTRPVADPKKRTLPPREASFDF
jgi:hypothetical protein